jgi:hypothetical protein
MGEYRHSETGEVKSQGEWRAHYKNVSLPRTWKAATLEGLQLDAVIDLPPPTVGTYEIAARNGAVMSDDGTWGSAWTVQDRFAQTTDADGVTTTKAEREADYKAELNAASASAVRLKRTELLADTDWTQLFDSPADSATWAAYRQALRDITKHPSFPHLSDNDWPVKSTTT